MLTKMMKETKEGIRNITRACKVTSSIFKKLIKRLKNKSFETEKDIYMFLRKETYSRGCKMAFRPVVVTNGNAAEIHHKPDNTKLKNGFLIVDFGVKYKGYCSDCTRTFYIGKPSKKEINLYNLVLMAQKTALNELKPGVYAADIDAIARAALWEYYTHFIHGLGHGVGKKVHKYPRISPRSKAILKEGMIFAIEPGIYFKNSFGIRIEDSVLLQKKPKILTNITKKLIVI